jgi:polysaccharide export outer membrane protein
MQFRSLPMRFLFVLVAVLTALVAHGFGQAAPLRPGDSFRIDLSGPSTEYTQEFRGLECTVGEDGTVSVPLLGPMRVSGMTARQLGATIERRFVAEKIFTNPTVQIQMQPQSRFVTVGGSVRVPSAVPWSADMSLSSAIKRAGGPTEFANLKRVRVTREGKTSVFNLRISDKDANQNPRLLPGDEVDVPE